MTAISVDASARRGSRWMNIAVRTKLFGLSGVLLGLLLFVTAISLSGLGKLEASVSEIQDNWSPSVASLGRIDVATGDLRLLAYQHMATDDDAGMASLEQDLATRLSELEQESASYEAMISSPEEKAIWDRFTAKWDAYLQQQNAALDLSRANSNAEATAAMLASDEAFDEAGKILAEDEQLNAAGAQAANKVSDDAYASSRTLLITVAAIAVLVGALLAWKIATEVAKRLSHTADVLDKVRHGDFRVRSGLTSTDEIGRVGSALDATLESTQETLTTIGDRATALAAAAEELSAVSSQLNSVVERTSSRAELVSSASYQASAAVSTVAAGSEEMGATVAEIARTSSSATEVVQRAVSLTTEASGVVNRLGEASAEIDNVVGFIVSIAEQTNLLALNATIEAARAGDAGRGFAVVASEVKDLASETAKATEQIRRTIEVIQRDSAAAMSSMGQVNEIIESISDNQITIGSAVEEQASTTQEISRNAQEVAVATNSIAESIREVADAANETGQSSGQVSDTAHEVARMASEVQALVGQFTL